MTHTARSRPHCSVCEHRLTVKELNNFLSMTDESLHNEVLCRDCMEALLLLCRECSRCYTAEGLCESCGGKAYGLAS
jgi:hypothetical protein